ncbi:hypothetical protein [Azoarcus sp. DN11]|uniref:hypothetical protein n=1 Tax=Azoarcus sp. DN11 TaxID=356837 RepID=UPI000EAC5C54|nr:hypothetical protein [Azoarcus sp. DN11]AYH43009.1 hypothetical protein CDA09_06345 [Azoarcus sp. DN11]
MQASKLITLTACLLACILGNGALAHEGQADEAAAPVVSSSAAPAPLAARFDLQIDGQRTDWYLWRDGNAIETANAGSGRGEIWERQGEQTYGYSRIFHHERKIVEYAPGELKTRNVEPDWEQLGSIISPRQLALLKRVEGKTLFGQKAVRYRGRLNGEKVDLWWLEQARLPALLHRTEGGRRVTLRLKELEAVSPATWPRVDASTVSGYGHIDAADFGDMETDPFVARVLHEDGHRHDH